jgi:xanthine/CO dehydrogenase XdhC/CoxF family maturation factor
LTASGGRYSRLAGAAVKHWKETSEVFERIARLSEAGHRAALATVVGTEGSAYRRAGAKFLIEDGGRTLGSLSGGCLEADVRENALQMLRDGAPPRLIRYDTGSDDEAVWGLGLGCSGTIEVFLQPAAGPRGIETTDRIRELLAGDSPFTISTVVAGPDSALGSVAVVPGTVRASHPDSTARIFDEVLVPPPYLLLVGAGDDAIPICAYAADVGFRVQVVDHREALLAAERFPAAFRRVLARPEDGLAALPVGPRSSAVIKTHSFAHDREWARRLLSAGISYVGLLGPRARTRKLLEEIEEREGERVFGPVGLDLGAEGPEQVALAIVAELLAVRAGREPLSLREKRSAIHVD